MLPQVSNTPNKVAPAEAAPPVGNDGIWLYRIAEDLQELEHRLKVLREALDVNIDKVAEPRVEALRMACNYLQSSSYWTLVAIRKLFKAAVDQKCHT